MDDNSTNKLVVAISACALVIGLGIMVIMPQCSAPKLAEAPANSSNASADNNTEGNSENNGTDANEADNAYEYTKLPSRITSVMPDETVTTETTFEYDKYGNVTREHHADMTTGAESSIEYLDYDERGYPHKAVFDDGTELEYTYEMNGDKAVLMSGSNGYTKAYTYYEDGTIDQETETYASGETVTTSYDADGKIMLIVRRTGESVFKTEYLWLCTENNDWPIEATVVETVDGEVTSEKTYQIAHDSQGHFMSATDEDGFIAFLGEYALIQEPSAHALAESKKIRF